MGKRASKLLIILSLGVTFVVVPTQLMAKKPNILVMWGE